MRKSLPIILLLCSAVMWGIALPFYKAADNIPPFAFGFFRFFIAFICITPVYLLSKWYQPVMWRDIPKLFLLGIFGVTLNIGLLFFGVRLTTATSAAVITNLTPVFVIVAAAIILKEPLTKHHVIGATLSMMGAFVIIGRPLIENGFGNTTQLMGNVLVLLATVSWTAYVIYSKELFARFAPLTIIFYLFATGVVTFLPMALIEYLLSPIWTTAVTAFDVSGVIYYAICGSLLAYFCHSYALSKTPASVVALVEYIVPIISISLAVLVLKEQLTPPLIIGAVFILCGVVYGSQISPHPLHKRYPSPPATPAG